MTLISELIQVPEQVSKGDFVLRLSEGVVNPARTVEQYEVTPQLRDCFDNALTFIKGALQDRSSKAAYLHGSFGSGKSHFMAILYLLLRHDPHVRAVPALAQVVSKHNEWTQGKRFLLVPYHMIGARNMESAILGGYAEHIRELHPEAPTPGVYVAGEIFADADRLRDAMGDEAFFAKLNEGNGGGEWGELEAVWDAERYAEAVEAPAKNELRVSLIGALVSKFFSAYQSVAMGKDEAFVSLDDGLSIISTHASKLGYDAVILFLDELILWLASHAADIDFVHREGQKLAKLVEAQSAERPVPIISFVARQRDLRELVGDNVTGAEQLRFSDALRHWEGRFHTFTLEDRNLPLIAEKRVLRPRSEGARQQLDEAFRQTEKVRQEVMNTLLTSRANREMFRKVYPFSPALVETLVAVSSVLQRERTALRIMLELLVRQRDMLRVGDIVPVGDLFDVIAQGDEAFSDVMRLHFENAKRLYHQKLLPALERQHGVRYEDIQQGAADPQAAQRFRNDDRLVKTLLLSALVPEVESLKGLTAGRLAALNHGTIKTPIPGNEGQEVLRRCRNWAGHIGEIKIGDEANPTISLQLTGVDTDSIIEQARREDSTGNRRRLLRHLLFTAMNIEGQDESTLRYDFEWRGTKRSCDVIFANVRELPFDSFVCSGPDWKVIVDYPFDVEGRTPNDDLSHLEKFRQAHPEPNLTLVWVPAFFTAQAQKDLGTLVILEHILTGERYAEYSAHLSIQDKAAAKTLLDNQRSQLKQRIMGYLEEAYGIATPTAHAVDTSHEISEHFHSLDGAFDLRPPVATDLGGGLVHLLDQALQHQYPAHPQFGAEVWRTANLRKVHQEVRRAIQEQDGRIEIDKPHRKLLRAIADPLMLGEMGETHFVLGHHWKQHFDRKAAEHGTGMSVGRLRRWMDEPRLMGLPGEAQNLVILMFAEQTARSFLLHGGPYEATLEKLPDELELREQRLPDARQWAAAREHASALLGLSVSSLPNAGSVARLNDDTRRMAQQLQAGCSKLYQALGRIYRDYGLDLNGTDRGRTAGAAVRFIQEVLAAPADEVVRVLAGVQPPTSAQAMGASLKQAADVADAIENTHWRVFESLGRLADQQRVEGDAILAELRSALSNDELVVPLRPAMRQLADRALDLVTRRAPSHGPPASTAGPAGPAGPGSPTPPGSPIPTAPPGVPGSAGSRPAFPAEMVINEGERVDVSPREAAELLNEIIAAMEQHADRRLDIRWRIIKKGSGG